MGGKPRTENPAHSTMSRRPVVAPKVSQSAAAVVEPVPVPVSVHDEVTRDYSIDPPSE